MAPPFLRSSFCLPLVLLPACGGSGSDGGSEATSESTETLGSGDEDSGDGDGDGSSADMQTTGSDECGNQSPSLWCDSMLAFYEDAKALHESQEVGCQLLTLWGEGIGPEGFVVDGVFAAPSHWTIAYVCPGRRIEYKYAAGDPSIRR